MATLPMSIIPQKPAGAQAPSVQFPGILTSANSALSERLKVGMGKKDIKAKKIGVLKTKLANIKKAKTLKKLSSVKIPKNKIK